MNDLSNTYVYQELSHEDIDILKKASVDDINDGISDLLYLIELNKLPMSKKLVEYVKSGKIRFVYSEKLTHATVRWVNDGGIVLVNASPNAKKKRGLEENYNIASNELYSLMLGATIFLKSDTFNRNRAYLKDVALGYMDLIGKAVAKSTGGHFSSPTETSKFHFIMTKYLFSKNKTAVSDIDGFVANLARTDERDVLILSKKYSDSDYDNLETVCEMLKKEFSWMNKLQPAGLIHTIATLFGASNTYMVESIDTIGCIIADHVIGGRPSLYSRYPNLRGIFKSTAYNNILAVVADL